MTTATTDHGYRHRVEVHFDELDPMGVLHNARYAVLFERALAAFWVEHGHSFVDGRPTTSDAFNVVKESTISYHTPVRGVGEIAVRVWLEHLGESSGVYRFRLESLDGATLFAESRRVVVKLDPATMRPAPWTAQSRLIAQTLLAPAPAAPTR
jgi:acyl-CoA thioester hydrolase